MIKNEVVLFVICVLVCSGFVISHVWNIISTQEQNWKIAISQCKKVFDTKNKDLTKVPFYNETYLAYESFKKDWKKWTWIDIENNTDLYVGRSHVLPVLSVMSMSPGTAYCSYTIHSDNDTYKYNIPLDAITGSWNLALK